MRNILLIIFSILLSINVWSQDCKQKYDAAMAFYNKGEYDKAAKMFKLVKESCGEGYIDCAAKERECNNRVKEDAEYSKCTTISGCDNYLKSYPNGKYVAKVKAKRAELKEDADYARCTTISACNSYLENYPNGRYVSKVIQKMDELGSEMYAYTAYMDIKNIEFANVDYYGNVINSEGSTLYASDMRYLRPILTYEGMSSGKQVTLYCEIVDPNGETMNGNDSPYGYTYTFTMNVLGGRNKVNMKSWGNSSESIYPSGYYDFKIWYNGEKIYSNIFYISEKANTLSKRNWVKALNKCTEYVMDNYDNGSYTGQKSDGYRSGLGMYKWNDGDYYIGKWTSGKWTGYGIYISGGGDLKSCPGCKYYVGDWVNGEKSGTGTCYDQYGKLIYYGDFANGAPVGTYPNPRLEEYKFEAIEYTNGSYYLGETKNGKRHGKGIYIWTSGDMWYGQWKDGSRDGYGIYMPYKGSISTGVWKGDEKQ